MKRLLSLALMTASILCFTMSTVHAYELNDYTLNFSAAGNALGVTLDDITGTDEWQFLAKSVVGFDDNDNSGALSIGDTFENYIAVRITGITDFNGGSLTVGTDYGSDYELTVLMQMSGTQTDTNAYTIDSLNDFSIYFDAGATFTSGSFVNISTLTDGIAVETGNLIQGGGNNTDSLGITGTLSLLLDLQDLLHLDDDANNEYFELDNNGQMFDMDLVMGIVDTGVNEQANADILDALETYFNIDTENFDFYFQSSNDGSFNKSVVPEPTTFLLLGVGLIGLASVSRKRHISNS